MEHLRKAHYDLCEIRKLLGNVNTRNITHTSQKDASILGYVTDEEIVERCCKLKKDEVYKTMTTNNDYTLWQDVYQTYDGEKKLYIKLQINNKKNGVVISFKPWEE